MDKPVRAMWVGLFALILLGMVSVILFLALGFHFFWLLQLTGVLTGSWALTGAIIGLVRGRRIARAL